MMETTATIEQIFRHGSVRSYTGEPVPDEMVEAIVAAGQRASTSSNLQTYSVVAVRDLETRLRLKELCGDQVHIAQAPVFLAWCADLSRLARASKAYGRMVASENLESFLVAAMDSVIAMQNAALAAESLGLGMCFIGAIRNNPAEVIRLLRLPPLVFPISGMTVGWPARAPRLRPRLPLKAVLHWERYDTTGEQEALAAYDREMAETGIYRGRQVAVGGASGETRPYGWLEHSTRRVSRPVRTGLRAEIEAQGFGLG